MVCLRQMVTVAGSMKRVMDIFVRLFMVFGGYISPFKSIIYCYAAERR